MSGFSSMAVPGGMPTSGSGKDMVSPESLFGSPKERAGRLNIIEPSVTDGVRIKVKKVKVDIFDLSDGRQVRRYEKLWKELLEKAARNEVIVEHSKNLVQRADGTSYWLKYVEYVEFGEDDRKDGK